MIQMAKDGLSGQAIAARTGITYQRVYQLISPYYKRPPKRRYCPVCGKGGYRANDACGQHRPWKHGNANGYHYHRCRCTLCRAWNTAIHRQQQASRREAVPPSHGISGYNNYGCRCEVCSTAQTLKMKTYTERRNHEQR